MRRYIIAILSLLALVGCNGLEDISGLEYQGPTEDMTGGDPVEPSLEGSDDEVPGGRVDLGDDEGSDDEEEDRVPSEEPVFVEGTVRVEDGADYRAVRDASYISGDLFILYTDIGDLEFPNLKRVGGQIVVQHNFSLRSLRMPKLEFAHYVMIASSTHSEMDLRSLRQVQTSLRVVSNENLPECIAEVLQRQVSATDYEFGWNREGCDCLSDGEGWVDPVCY